MSDELVLVTPNALRYRIASEGLVIGRAARCELVVEDPSISRIQAIVYPSDGAATLVVVGSGPTAVNGRTASASHALALGDLLAIGESSYRLERQPTNHDHVAAWMIKDRTGQLYGITRTDVVIGGGASATIRVPGWPERVAILHAGSRLTVEACHELELGGVVIGAGEVVTAEVGQELVLGDHGFRVIAGGAGNAASTIPKWTPPDRAVLELLPRGGRLVLGWGDREGTVYLPERRCELLALLLQPPTPYRSGELIPDELVLGRLDCDRVQLNVLVHRARGDLARAGFDGIALIERARGGTATRLVTAPGALIAVQ